MCNFCKNINRNVKQFYAMFRSSRQIIWGSCPPPQRLFWGYLSCLIESVHMSTWDNIQPNTGIWCCPGQLLCYVPKKQCIARVSKLMNRTHWLRWPNCTLISRERKKIKEFPAESCPMDKVLFPWFLKDQLTASSCHDPKAFRVYDPEGSSHVDWGPGT